MNVSANMEDIYKKVAKQQTKPVTQTRPSGQPPKRVVKPTQTARPTQTAKPTQSAKQKSVAQSPRPPVAPQKPERNVAPVTNTRKQQTKVAPAEPQEEAVVVDYLANERKYGYGLGVTGLGRMVHFEGLTDDGAVQYRLRTTVDSKKATSDRIPKYKPDGEIDPDYMQDVCRTTKVSVYKPLLDEVCEQLQDTLGLNFQLKGTDVVAYLLYRELTGRYDKVLLEPLLTERYGDFKYLALHDKSKTETATPTINHDIETMEQTLHQMAEQIQSSARVLHQIQASVHKTQNQLKENNEVVHGVAHAVSYQLASDAGVISNSVTDNEAVMQSYLQADDAIRVARIVRKVGADAVAREATVSVDKTRRNKPPTS